MVMNMEYVCVYQGPLYYMTTATSVAVNSTIVAKKRTWLCAFLVPCFAYSQAHLPWLNNSRELSLLVG